MSSISSPASAPSASGSNEPGCKRARSARSTRSAAKSSKSTGRKSPATKTSELSPPSACEQMELSLTSSAAASPARTFHSPERVRVLMAAEAAYGASTPELLASFDPATSSWRTSQHCLVEGLAAFSGTWPRSGTMRSGIAFRRLPLVPLTSAIGSGLWPTPTASDGDKGSTTYQRGNPSLRGAALRWPTPAASDATRGGTITANMTGQSLAQAVNTPLWPTPREARGRYQRRWGRIYPSLEGAVEIFPTPNASDGKGGRRTPEARDAARAKAKPRKNGGPPGMARLRDITWASPAARDYRSVRGRSANGHTPQLPEQAGGQLNPTWVEWLMGLPLGWTVVSVLKRSATATSRTSPKSSAAASSHSKRRRKKPHD